MQNRYQSTTFDLYFWVDTCCIDKSSSAELSEAINSMFRWYAQSSVYYAFLVDVHIARSKPEDLNKFERSRWHKRGSTLQELLAPGKVEFYDSAWHHFGTRESLSKTTSNVTGIQEDVFGTKVRRRIIQKTILCSAQDVLGSQQVHQQDRGSGVLSYGNLRHQSTSSVQRRAASIPAITAADTRWNGGLFALCLERGATVS